ncbi:MAG: hypothetical protein CMH62_00465 [Nanoarchaeota archaeon]|nr:hypothetical protein [Nanoarchaeota archaeon]|tara:strand:- start:126 stop:1037 length:912 start_codon:yes stop_codon:yes gene_type:complete
MIERIDNLEDDPYNLFPPTGTVVYGCLAKEIERILDGDIVLLVGAENCNGTTKGLVSKRKSVISASAVDCKLTAEDTVVVSGTVSHSHLKAGKSVEAGNVFNRYQTANSGSTLEVTASYDISKKEGIEHRYHQALERSKPIGIDVIKHLAANVPLKGLLGRLEISPYDLLKTEHEDTLKKMIDFVRRQGRNPETRQSEAKYLTRKVEEYHREAEDFFRYHDDVTQDRFGPGIFVHNFINEGTEIIMGNGDSTQTYKVDRDIQIPKGKIYRATLRNGRIFTYTEKESRDSLGLETRVKEYDLAA